MNPSRSRSPVPRSRPQVWSAFVRARWLALLLATLIAPSSLAGASPAPVGPRADDALEPRARQASQLVDGNWETQTSSISQGAAVYDPVRDRMLIFGGTNGTHYINEVWELTLEGVPTWSRVTTTGDPPPPRALTVAIYDAGNDRVLVFGGWNGTSHLADLWELTLSGTPRWTQLAPAGPYPYPTGRITGVLDSDRNRIVIFWDTGFTNTGIWALSLSGPLGWSQLSVTGGPAVGYQPTAIYDATRDRMVLFGNDNQIMGTWVLSFSGAATWSQISGGPQIRNGKAVLYDPVRDRMLLFGGMTAWPGPDSCASVVWSLQLGTGAWSTLSTSGPNPGRRCWWNPIYDPERDRAVLQGTEVWALTLPGTPTWSRMAEIFQPRPPALVYHTAIEDAQRDRMLIYGGHSARDVWRLDLGDIESWGILTVSGAPPGPYYGHSAIYDPVRERMLVFGGWGGASRNETWELSLSGSGVPTWTHLVLPSRPPERGNHSAVYDPIRNRMLVFGGWGTSSSDLLNDVWQLTLGGSPAWTQIIPAGSPPSRRYGHAALYDPLRDRMLMFGGSNSDGHDDDELWELSFSGPPVWTLLGSAPVVRSKVSAIYDPFLDRMVVYGGEGDPQGRSSSTFAFDLSGGAGWTMLSPTGTAPVRADHSGIFDSRRDRLLVFGGYGPFVTANNSLHILDWGAVPAAVPGPTSASRQDVWLEISPNPTQRDLWIDFSLTRATDVRLSVVDIQGRVVTSLAGGWFAPGQHRVAWDGRTKNGAARAGLYFLRLIANGRILVRRAVITP